MLVMKAKILDHHSALHSGDIDNRLKELAAQCCSKATEIPNCARNMHSLKIPEATPGMPLQSAVKTLSFGENLKHFRVRFLTLQTKGLGLGNL